MSYNWNDDHDHTAESSEHIIKNLRLVPMTRELCHTFYQAYEEDPAARPLNEAECPYYRYDPVQVDRYFEEQQDPTRVCFSILKDDRPIGEIKLKYIDHDKKECSMGIHLSTPMPATITCAANMFWKK